MKKMLIISLLYSFVGIFVKSQNTTTSSTQTCDITAYNELCYNNKNCAFVESQKDSNKYFACLAVQPKDCNFFCNYFNELNSEGGITSLSCVCNGIKYPTNSS
jgi:hypothetical protein